VATVSSDGTVTAVAAGSATITVTTADGGKTATCYVTVNSVPVTGVYLNATRTTLQLGDWTMASSVTLIATVLPTNATNKNVTWSSSNPGVATVSTYGTVTGIALGTTVITVTTVDGGYTATCLVTVGSRVTGISLVEGTEHTIELPQGGMSYNFNPRISPDDAADRRVTWSSSNPEVVPIDAYGRGVAEKLGTSTITVTTVDGGFKASCEVTVVRVPVTGVSLLDNRELPKTSVTLQVAPASTMPYSTVLYAQVWPRHPTNMLVTWSCSDPDVVGMNGYGGNPQTLVTPDASIYARKPGTATITVTTVDGGFQATCLVTVIPSDY
jgi:uncharacterized protein YjdB